VTDIVAGKKRTISKNEQIQKTKFKKQN